MDCSCSLLERGNAGEFATQVAGIGFEPIQVMSLKVAHDVRWTVARKEDNMTNNILKLAQQARTNAQLLTVNQSGIRSLTREDALKTRGEVVEAIRRLQVFEKDLAKKLDT